MQEVERSHVGAGASADMPCARCVCAERVEGREAPAHSYYGYGDYDCCCCCCCFYYDFFSATATTRCLQSREMRRGAVQSAQTETVRRRRGCSVLVPSTERKALLHWPASASEVGARCTHLPSRRSRLIISYPLVPERGERPIYTNHAHVGPYCRCRCHMHELLLPRAPPPPHRRRSLPPWCVMSRVASFVESQCVVPTSAMRGIEFESVCAM